MTVSRRQTSQRIGNIGEKFACKLLGKHIHPNMSKLTPVLIRQNCDILQGDVKIEVKTSNLVRRKIPCLRGKKSYSWYGYRFHVIKQVLTADFFLFVCLDEYEKPFRAYYVPAFLIPKTTRIDLHESSKKFDEFIVYPIGGKK